MTTVGLVRADSDNDGSYHTSNNNMHAYTDSKLASRMPLLAFQSK